jgi:hypothetical protein
LARQLSIVIGKRTAVVDRYECELSKAPLEHLQMLSRRSAAIVFAPTIPDALRSREATLRRGRSLSTAELLDHDATYGPGTAAVGLYEPALDWLIFPTSYRVADLEWPVMHELGHALTHRWAWHHAEKLRRLLDDLPAAIAQHIAQPGYDSVDPALKLRMQVSEVLAEVYVRLVADVGGAYASLVSELIGILSDMDRARPEHLRSSTDPESGRTATFSDPAHLLRIDDDLAKPLSGDQVPVASFVADERLIKPPAEWKP